MYLGEEDFIMNTNSRNTDVDKRLKVAEKLLNDLIKHEDGWPFLKPVSKRDVNIYVLFWVFGYLGKITLK